MILTADELAALMTGKGLVGFDIALWLGCVVACIAHLALLRTPLVTESFLGAAMRRIKIVSWGMFAIRFGVLLWQKHDLMISLYAVVPFLLLAWADALIALSRLLPEYSEKPQVGKL